MRFLKNVDIFDYEDKGILVIPVNGVGVMGAGLAKQFAKRHPDIEKEYKRLSEDWWKLQYYHYTRNFVLFKTKNHYKDKTDLDEMLYGMRETLDSLRHWAGTTKYEIHWPKVGCGLGGLSWESAKYEIVGELARAERLYGYRMVVHQ